MIDSSKASDFHWDHEVCEFFETVKYLGGQRTRNFLRGPGFHGTGRGGKKQFTTFADFNLCGPSHNVSNRCKAGYTTDSGIIKPHLQSFHVFSSHPKADINYLVSSDQVQVIGVSLTMDGTALKPGLEFDTRQKRIIGLTYKVDWNYVCDNPVPKPEEIKANLITSAEVTFMTSVDNSSTMPVGVHYHPKSVSGQDILSQMLGMAKTVQACDRCLNKQPAKNHIVTHNTSLCNSTKCDRCLQMKAVCQECQRKGHLSYLPALRSCESCLEESVQCRKVAVLAVVTDCEECNKQALLEIQKMSENNTMPPELLLLTPLPDVVHIDKIVYFAAAKSPHCNGGLYCFDIESSEVTNVLGNMTDNCREIKKVARFKETLVFTDVGGRQVKRYNPTTKEIETLAGDGCEGAQDGTEKSCSFVQVHGVCSVSDSVFTTDAAAGKIKLLTGLSGTTDFLKHLGILYDTFGITCKAATSQPITPEQVIQNLNTVDGYIKATVMNVKETNNLKENSTTNGPQGTVSQKTQTSIELLLNGVKSLVSKVTVVNPSYKDTIDWKTLLTTIVENLHAVSHFKHETFDVLQYATDFGTISKESLKRITKWGRNTSRIHLHTTQCHRLGWRSRTYST
ncbi:unnamed protein product [Porites lobata]|uniref:Uncharacterized protein n=1 Tax=Porites lobata TaxID=104759 RepID=A0ABN8QX46_9CNID|nr:unnamed protein product [Porites lobata]